MPDTPMTEIEKLLNYLLYFSSRNLPLYIDRLWKSYIYEFWRQFLQLFAPYVLKLLLFDARPLIFWGPEIHDSDATRKMDVYMILQALDCEEFRDLFFEFTGRKYQPLTGTPLIKLFIEQQEQYDPLMRFRMQQQYTSIKTSQPPGITTGILLSTGNRHEAPPYRAEFGGFSERLDYPVYFAADFTEARVKETGNNLFSVLMLASNLATQVTGSNRKEKVPKLAEKLKNLILSINYGDSREKAALVFVLIRFHLDDPDLELNPELLEVYKMAAQSYLTDSGDLLKRLTIDEIEKRSLEQGLERGLERGREEALLEVARKLLARNTTPADVAELTGLDAAAIKNIT